MPGPRIFKLFVFSVSVILAQVSVGQTIGQIKEINVLSDSLKKLENDSTKFIINQEITQKLQNILLQAENFDFSFDSLKSVGHIKSPDNAFSIFTWNVPLEDGSNKYFGIIQMDPLKNSECKLHLLNDISQNTNENINLQTLNMQQWFGALYYQVIKVKVDGKIVYTLLATRFKDLFVNQKVIETLSFNENGFPVFGQPIIEYGLKPAKRVVFEYSINAVMSLKYWEDSKMIVFDHLAPSSPIYNGNFKFYGPDFTYDAFKFEDEKWKYMPNINMKNSRNTGSSRTIRRINTAPVKK